MLIGNVPKKSCRPIFGFANARHVDNADRLTSEQLEEWKEIAQAKNWKSCLRVLEQDGCGLPTTCGYQFVFKKEVEWNVSAYFAMDGLGIGIAL